MKRVYVILLSLVCVLQAVVLGAQTKEERFVKRFPYKHEFRIGWAGYPLNDSDCYVNAESNFMSSALDRMYSPQWGAKYMTGIIYGEYSIHFKRWFTLSVMAGVNGIWGKRYDPAYDRWAGNRSGAVVTLLPMARFNWVNARTVRLYSAVGLGVSAGGFDGKFDAYPSFQVTPFGITIGRKVFFFGECALGTSWLGGDFGIGYRF